MTKSRLQVSEGDASVFETHTFNCVYTFGEVLRWANNTVYHKVCNAKNDLALSLDESA